MGEVGLFRLNLDNKSLVCCFLIEFLISESAFVSVEFIIEKLVSGLKFLFRALFWKNDNEEVMKICLKISIPLILFRCWI